MNKKFIILFVIIGCCILSILFISFKYSGNYIVNQDPNNDQLKSISETISEYQKGLDNIPNPWLFQLDKDYVIKLKKASNLIKEYSQITAMPFLNPPQQSLMYKGITPWKNNPESNFKFNFKDTFLGWYFMYGSTKNYRFTLMIFHIGLNGKNPERGLYSIVGGCDYGSGWIPIPQNGHPAKYVCDDKQNIKFEYKNDNKKIIATFDRNTKTSKMDLYVEYEKIKLTVSLSPTKKAEYNGPNGGCVPACFGNLGTLYWSYTNPKCTIQINKKEKETGLGWFDHQNISGGIPHGIFNQMIYSFIMDGKIPSTISWLWLTIQLEDRQYGGDIIIEESQIPLKVGMKFTNPLNKYTSNGVTYNLSGCIIEIIETTTVNLPKFNYDMIFPTKYKFIIPGENEIILKSDFNREPDVVFMPSGSLNWEGPGTAYDNKSKKIGNGFLEGNNLLSYDILNKITIQTAFPKENYIKANLPLLQKPLSKLGIYVSIIYICLIIILLVCIIITLIYLFSKRKRKRKRK